MILNLSANLAKKLKIEPPKGSQIEPIPYEEWFGHTFTFDRKHYILTLEGNSKFTAIIEAKGLKDAEHYASSLLIEIMDLCKIYKISEPLSKVLISHTSGLIVQRNSNKSIVAFLNQMIFHACYYMSVGNSTTETALKLNEMPIGVLKGSYFPIEIFAKEKIRLMF